MENFYPSFLEHAGTKIGTSRGRRDELDALLDNEINHICALHERKCHVHTKGLIGHFVHLGDFDFNRIEIPRGRLDDAHRTCV